MNNSDSAIKQVEEFLASNEKCMILSGTNQYKKHKLIMAILNKHYSNNLVLFRSNSMENITNNDFLGFAGVNKNKKSGEKFRIENNIYEVDSLNTESTWSRTSDNIDFAIIYPVDVIIRKQDFNSIENLLKYKKANKIFLVTWTDTKLDLSCLNKYSSRHVIYDAEEENPEYHNRVLGCE